MYEKSYGERYDAKYSKTEISALIRGDIKAAIKAGTLAAGTYSVVTRHHNAIDITIKALSFNPMNPEYVKWAKENPNEYRGDMHPSDPRYKKYTPEGESVEKKLKAMLWAYNYDGSDIQSDYFNVNFYSSVNFGWEAEKQWRAEILGETVAPKIVPKKVVREVPENVGTVVIKWSETRETAFYILKHDGWTAKSSRHANHRYSLIGKMGGSHSLFAYECGSWSLNSGAKTTWIQPNSSARVIVTLTPVAEPIKTERPASEVKPMILTYDRPDEFAQPVSADELAFVRSFAKV